MNQDILAGGIVIRAGLRPADLMGLEQYARARAEFRGRVLTHKQLRTLGVGPHTTWIFEDRLTVQYQVQEMLRAERIFEPDAIQQELDAYNPLIPDGSNWKVTLLIEFTEPDERKVWLSRLKGIEARCYVQAAGFERVYAIADEDLERENDEKTSAVHWLRFQLTPAMRAAVRTGTPVTVGIDHAAYEHALNLSPQSAAALARDLD